MARPLAAPAPLPRSSEPAWYAPLLVPVRPVVDGALRTLEHPDPWSVPRAGLGGAITALVARSYGRRRWQEAARVGAMAVEAWNQRVHLGAPEAGERAGWLGRDVSRMRRVWGELWRRDAALLDRVVDRALATSTAGPIPEAVLLLRGAVAAGVLAGDVPDAVHDVLDRAATALGEALEGGPLPDLSGLPDSAFAELLRDCVACGLPAPAPRCFEAWVPVRVPLPGPALRVVPSGPDPLSRFAARWQAPVEQALADAIDDGSTVGTAALGLLRAGGKRLRPLLVLASAEAAGGAAEDALPAAALVEWLHQASLVIDDVVDEAEVRRHVRTLHRATSVPFALGTAAVTLGRIHQQARALPPAVRHRLSVAATALAEGQRSELQHTGDDALSLTGYYAIIEAKTARLFACAAAVGGACAGDRHLAALHAYGSELGLAFQIVDDVLDYVGDEPVLGKRPGTDLRAGKVTLPVLVLRERLRGAERERLAALVAGCPREDDFAWVRERILGLGVHEDCLGRARTHRDRALDALTRLPHPEVLAALADRFVERRR